MKKKILLFLSSLFAVCQCDDSRKDSKVNASNLDYYQSVHHLMTDPEKLLLFGHESEGPSYEVFEPSNWSKIRSNLQYLNHKKLHHSKKIKNEEKGESWKNNGDINPNSDQRKGREKERMKRSVNERKKRRRKRSHAYINYNSDNYNQKRIKEYPSKLRIKFMAFNQKFDLILEQNDNLFSNNFFIQEEEEDLYHNDTTKNNGIKLKWNEFISDKKIQLTNCYYQGSCILHPNSSAAISMCEGMRGLIETKEAIYVVNPLPNGVVNKYNQVYNNGLMNDFSHPHVIVKKEPNDGYSCPHRRSSSISSNSSSSSSSSSSSAQLSLLYSDLAQSVFKDQSIFHSKLNMSQSRKRIRRSLSNEFPEGEEKDEMDSVGSSKVGVTVETAVFVDETLYEIMRRTYPVDTEQEIVTYILTIMNAVQLLFKQASLGRDVSISVILMDILKIQPRDLISSDNIDTYLTNFCVWQHNKRINSRGLTPRWDHALLLSGINMYVVDGQGRKKRHVVGLAPVSGMCNSLNSCTISEGTSFQTVLVAGHEMGHSLGMEHDGPQDGNSCDQNDFIMSPTLGAGKTSWSSCSKRYLDKFLKLDQASCVLGTSSHVNILHQFSTQNKLPGQIFDADQQCALRFGSDSRKSSVQSITDVCRLLRCDTGSKRNTVVYHAHPALEGTSCGKNKWCREGSCIDMDHSSGGIVTMHATASDLNSIEKKKEDSIHVIDSRWSSWSSWTPCSSECIIRSEHHSNPIVGISWSTRKCNTPSPSLNGGTFCDGNDKMAKLCDASQLCLSSPVYKMVTISEYIDDVCRVASKRDSNLEPKGTQYPSYDRSHSCYVWCHKKGGGFMTQGWKLPDGTPCGRESYSRSLSSSSANRFCVNGECRPFDCDGINNDKSPTDVCPLPFSAVSQSSSLESRSSEKTQVMKSPATSVWSPWIPLTSCHFPCLVKGRGIQLITRECNSIGSCHGMRDWFQLCPKSEDTCLPSKIKSADEYANDLCHKYRYRYPTLLSGRGRQLSPRNGNPNTACIVACQDRVWRDIHYQMDAFEDGKFPLGTDCSSPGSRSGNGHQTAYCVDGRCIKFDENDFPVETNIETITHVKSFLSREFRYLNRHRRSTPSNNNNPTIVHKKAPIQDTQFYGERIVPLSNRGIPNWNPLRPPRPARFESPIEDSNNSSDTLRLQTYLWGMSISECSSPCGTGHQIIRVYCHSGHVIVDDKFCSDSLKPIESGVRACNQHECTGSWRVEKWSSCSATCGSGFRTRAVICVHKTGHENVFSLKDSLCSRRDKPSGFESCHTNCIHNQPNTSNSRGL